MALLDSIVAIGILLVIAIGTYLITKKTPFLPYSIVLVLVGLVINSLQLPVFSGVELTPEILFYIFLPILLFESAYNLDLRMIRRDSVPITILATLGVVLSAFIVGWGMMYFLNIPFIAALLFASVIASTDPIAVIALFKELGVNKRLTQLVDGESMANDGTSVIMFNIVKAFVPASLFVGSAYGDSHSNQSSTGIISGLTDNLVVNNLAQGVWAIGGAIVFGAVFAYLISWMIQRINNDLGVELTLSILTAHAVFIIADHLMHVSGIIAVVSSGLVIGSYGRDFFSPQIKHTISHVWEFMAFLSNSMVFLLIGVTFSLSELIPYLPGIVLIYLLVLVSRAVAVYGLTLPYNLLNKENAIPMSWQHVLNWGGLRGSLPIIVILTLGDNFVYADEFKHYVVGVVLLSLVVNGLTIKPLVSWLGINKGEAREVTEVRIIQLLMRLAAQQRLEELNSRGTVTSAQYDALKHEYTTDIDRLILDLGDLSKQEHAYVLQVLVRFSFSLEREVYIEMYEKGMFNQQLFAGLKSKIIDDIDQWESGESYESLYAKSLLSSNNDRFKSSLSLAELYWYRKVREIGNTAVLRELVVFSSCKPLAVEVKKIIQVYEQFATRNREQLAALDALVDDATKEKILRNEIQHRQEMILDSLYESGRVSTYTYQTLHQ